MFNFVQVISRKSRRHYGVKKNTSFDASIHPPSCKQWDDLDEKWKAADRMTWYIQKGDTVSSTAPILFPFYRTFAKGSRKTGTSSLIVCDREVAPDGFEYGPRSPTRVLCKLDIDFQKIPSRLWKKRFTSEGKPYDKINYQLGMQIGSGTIKFDLRVGDVVYGDVTAKFEAD